MTARHGGQTPTGPAMRRILVVGYGIAGLTAAETLRDAGFDGELTIVGGEHDRPYSRPALSKALLSDPHRPADPTVLALTDSQHRSVEILGVRAAELRRDERTIRCSDGSILAYDGLVIATGSRPRRFTDSPHELTLRTREDALELRRRLTARPHVTIIGGGPLGMEVASGARDFDCEVQLVHRGTPMENQIGTFLGGICADKAQDHGVTLINDFARSVDSSTSSGGGTALRRGAVNLASGAQLDTELLVSAVGEDPEIAWLGDSDLLTDKRLVTDERGFVAENIIAVGDVAWTAVGQEGPDGLALRRAPLWTHAIDQSRAAALALIKGREADPFHPRPYFWTEQFGLHIRMCGDLPEGEPLIVDGDPAKRSALLHWPSDAESGRPGTAAAINYRYPIPRLRRLANS